MVRWSDFFSDTFSEMHKEKVKLRIGEILERASAEGYLVKYEDYKEELLRIEPADFSSWSEGTPEHTFGDV